MNFKKKLLLLFFLFAYFIPCITFAYSDKVILGGNNIGITVNTKDILVVGFYKVDGKYIGRDAGIKIGDSITKINGTKVNTIPQMIEIINNEMKNNSILITEKRNNQELDLKLNLVEKEDTYKTGLYIKDQITGIGTLTYIDPETNIYGALGHEIINSSNSKLVEISGGKIFKASITGNTKSTITSTGEKNAIFDSNTIYGTIKENTTKGIYGKYSSRSNNEKLIEVADKNEIKLGKAYIYTVLKDNEIGKYEINIININKNSTTKNILFEITDKTLIEKTNGVIKGMSGSPIVQNDKLIGAVTHAIVNDNTKGYGIFITTMLEEGEN